MIWPCLHFPKQTYQSLLCSPISFISFLSVSLCANLIPFCGVCPCFSCVGNTLLALYMAGSLLPTTLCLKHQRVFPDLSPKAASPPLTLSLGYFYSHYLKLYHLFHLFFVCLPYQNVSSKRSRLLNDHCYIPTAQKNAQRKVGTQ